MMNGYENESVRLFNENEQKIVWHITWWIDEYESVH